MPATEPPRIGLLAGEASGDLLGASLMRELARQAPGATFVGVGGERMRAEGMDCLLPTESLAMNGFAEPIRRLPELLAIHRRLRRELTARDIDVFVGVDFNVFNLILERSLKRRGVPTVHYVSPSVYAWRRGRLRRLGRSVDRVLALYPFEPPLYADAGVDAVFVGHPLADEIGEVTDPAPARRRLGVPPDAPLVLAVMPGSRTSELEQLGADFAAAAALVAERVPGTRVIVAVLDEPAATRMRTLFRQAGVAADVRVGDARDAQAAADLVLVKSGTGTLETMLTGRPMVVAYRVGPWTYRILAQLVKTPWIALPNILAGETLVPELIQDAASPEALADALLAQRDRAGELRSRFRELAATLRRDAARQAARAVLELVPDAAQGVRS